MLLKMKQHLLLQEISENKEEPLKEWENGPGKTVDTVQPNQTETPSAQHDSLKDNQSQGSQTPGPDNEEKDPENLAPPAEKVQSQDSKTIQSENQPAQGDSLHDDQGSQTTGPDNEDKQS